jgi:hypothetical protein
MSLEHSEVAISLSSYSWDAMPMDVPRPLSQTQLGVLVILAMRMGMVWTKNVKGLRLCHNGSLSTGRT